MGVVNVTPDSFSDGGRWADPEAAIAHGRDAARRRRRHPRRRRRVDPARRHPAAGRGGAGAGGPGDHRLAADGAVVSVDTMRAEVARGRRRRRARPSSTTSPAGWPTRTMLDVVADAGATYVAMHWRGHSDRMQRARRLRRAGRRGRRGPRRARGAGRRDAGGRASTGPDRARPRPRLRQDRRPELGAAARPRRAAGARLPAAGRRRAASVPRRRARRRRTAAPRPVDEREYASTALTVLLAERGVWGLRVHDVRAAPRRPPGARPGLEG